MNFEERGATRDWEGNRPFFRFSDEAQGVFYEWLTDLERNKLQSTEDHSLMIEHLSKYRKLMPALALIFHLTELADGSNAVAISSENAERACAFCEYLESHARRIYGLVTDINTNAASILAKKIAEGKLKDGFTVRDVYRLKGVLKDKEIAKIACNELVDLDWLSATETSSGWGQKAKTAYTINPKIKQVSSHG